MITLTKLGTELAALGERGAIDVPVFQKACNRLMALPISYVGEVPQALAVATVNLYLFYRDNTNLEEAVNFLSSDVVHLHPGLADLPMIVQNAVYPYLSDEFRATFDPIEASKDEERNPAAEIDYGIEEAPSGEFRT